MDYTTLKLVYYFVVFTGLLFWYILYCGNRYHISPPQ
jgi:hypothetical protein